MHDLVTCKFDKDQVKNEHAGVETSFFPLYYDNFFQCSRSRYIEVNNPIRLEFELK